MTGGSVQVPHAFFFPNAGCKVPDHVQNTPDPLLFGFAAPRAQWQARMAPATRHLRTFPYMSSSTAKRKLWCQLYSCNAGYGTATNGYPCTGNTSVLQLMMMVLIGAVSDLHCAPWVGQLRECEHAYAQRARRGTTQTCSCTAHVKFYKKCYTRARAVRGSAVCRAGCE